MSEQSGLSGSGWKQSGGKHFHPLFATLRPHRQVGSLSKLLQRLGALCFPWHILDYPGRNRALAEALGYSVGTIEHGVKGRLTPAMALRAEKFCRAMALELVALADLFKAEGEKLAAKKAPKRRGFLTVRIRDETGIPRNARWSGRKNSVAADKPKPF